MVQQVLPAKVDVERLRGQIQEKYRDVALEPEKGFHFHTGRPLAAMLEKTRAAARAAGLANVDSRHGYAEELPAASESIDVVISNGVINLCPDKMKVMSEVYRVLKPGGRFQIGDIVVHKEVPQDAKDDIDLWSG